MNGIPRRIKIGIQYDGTDYGGWQVQPNAVTVQEKVQDSVRSLTGKMSPVAASGRTDAGVHAIEQVAHFDTYSDIPLEKFVPGLNRFLPKDIAVLWAEETDSNFHARFSARGKIYIYKIYLSRTPAPLFARTHHICPYDLFAKTMQTAALELSGTHDFASFCSSGSGSESTIRTIYSLDISHSEKELTLRFYGSGFLYNMVRNITGLLIEVGRGKVHENEVRALLNACDRTAVPYCAPASGLYLEKILY